MSLYTVSRKLGHGSEEMVRRVYSHLGEVRHRSDVVEYRWRSTSSAWVIGSSGLVSGGGLTLGRTLLGRGR